jgi:hypothetical protein
MVVRSGTVLRGKLFHCDVVIRAQNVEIRDSRIFGRLISDGSGSVTVSVSFIDGGAQEDFPAVSMQNITLVRVEVVGGQHSVQCGRSCTIRDSWLHEQYLTPDSAGHVNAFLSNGGAHFTLIHNTLACTARPTEAGGGCTADASLFGDFSAISFATFDHNLFRSNTDGAGYCLQAGDSPDKPFPHASHVVVVNNVFERGGKASRCGIYGPETGFDETDKSNVWANNTFDDGTPVG